MENLIKPITIDEFLTTSSRPIFKATIEPIKDEDDKVKITPYLSGSGCSCQTSLVLPKSVIDTVVLTSDTHVCCGKNLRVVEINFKADQPLDLIEIFSQLTSRKEHKNEAHNLSPKENYDLDLYNEPSFNYLPHRKHYRSLPPSFYGIKAPRKTRYGYNCCCGPGNCSECSEPCSGDPCINPCD